MAWTNWHPYPVPKGWKATRNRIMNRDNGCCYVCGHEGADQIDHIISIANGGSHDDTNLAPIHRVPCHSTKTRTEQVQRTVTTQPAPKLRRNPEKHPGFI